MATNFNGSKKWLTEFAQQAALQSLEDNPVAPAELLPKMLTVTPNIARINSLLEQPEMQSLSLKEKITQPLKTIEQKINTLMSLIPPYQKSGERVMELEKRAETIVGNYEDQSDALKQKAFEALENSFSDKQKILKPSLMALNNISLNPITKPKLTSKEAKMFNELNKDFPYKENLGIDKKVYQQTMVQIAKILTAKSYEPDKIHQTALNSELNLIFRPTPANAWWKAFDELSGMRKEINPLVEEHKKDIEKAAKDATVLSQTAAEIDQAFTQVGQSLTGGPAAMGVESLSSEQWKGITEIAHCVADIKNNISISFLDFARGADLQVENLKDNSVLRV